MIRLSQLLRQLVPLFENFLGLGKPEQQFLLVRVFSFASIPSTRRDPMNTMFNTQFRPGSSRASVCIFLAVALYFNCALGDSWSSWRGSLGNGSVQSHKLSSEIDLVKHLQWKTKLPFKGNSTPILSSGKIFLTQGSPEDGSRALACYRLEDGQHLWTSGTLFKGEESTHRENPYAAASPVTDGRFVIATFGSAGVFLF